MDIRNCKECGKIYQYDGFKICLNCRRKEDEIFKNVKEYIYDHPGANIQVVSEETDVSVNKILSYLREGRLELTGDHNNLILECERCGVSINTGRFCDKCIVELERELKSSITKSDENKAKPKVEDKMYIANRHKR